MSMPNIPDIKPDIDIDRDKAIDLLLASIALEEMGLAHIMNAEAEKIQYLLGTLEKNDCCQCCCKDFPTFEELLKINRSVERMMRKIIEEEIVLEFKLEDAVDLAKLYGHRCEY